MEFLTTWWFITAVVLAVVMMVIYFLQEYFRIYKKLPFIDRLRKNGIHPTIRKPPGQNNFEDKDNDNS